MKLYTNESWEILKFPSWNKLLNKQHSENTQEDDSLNEGNPLELAHNILLDMPINADDMAESINVR